MSPFQSLRNYENFVYTLPQQFPSITMSTLVLAQRGRLYAELVGELVFTSDHRLVIFERLTWETGRLIIEGYSHEAWQGSEKLYWYDSQPHPGDPTLAATDPHHKHVPPDIKHHRIPAPDLSFNSANLPVLIREIENL